MFQFLNSYRRLDRKILLVIGSEFVQRILFASNVLIFNYYLLDHGYRDFEIARLLSLQFITVMLVSLPYGLWIKTRPLLPIMKMCSLLIPFVSMGILWGVAEGLNWIVYPAFFL